MENSIFFVIVVILLFFSGVSSIFETALTAVNRLKMKVRAEKGDKKAIKILKLLDMYDRSIISIVVFDNLINILLPTFSLLFFMELLNNEGLAASLSTIIMTILVIIFGEITPKLYGKLKSEQALYMLIGLFEFLIFIMYPIALIVNLLTTVIKKILIRNNVDDSDLDKEILTMINESHEDGEIEDEQKKMVTKAINFGNKTVEMIMKPQRDVIMFDKNINKDDMLEALIKYKYSRIPIYEGDTNNIIGILSERNFLNEYSINKDFDINSVIQEVKFIPDSLKIALLLPNMQKSKSHIAIAVDEYGTVQGIITIEDILEELVGNIWDEHDVVRKECKKIANNKYEVLGEARIEDIEEEIDFKLDIQLEEENTIAGFFIESLQKIPEVGDCIDTKNAKYTIIDVDSMRINKILLELKK